MGREVCIMAKMKDIAELAGVNVTTVSKALRGSSDINRETAARIWALANQLGYQPKHIEKKQSDVVRIGLICPAAGSTLNDMVVPMQRANYEMVTYISYFDVELEKRLIAQLAEDVDGIIYLNSLGVPLDDIHINKPMVVVGPRQQSDRYDVLMVDERAGYRQAIEHLVSLGHRRFGFLGDRYYAGRLNDVRAELERYGLDIAPECISIELKERHLTGGYMGIEPLIKLDDRPTALLVQYDDMAFGAVERMQELGIRIPEDISIVGFDDVDYCVHFRPRLSSITSFGVKMAEIATSIMKKKIRDPQYGVVQAVEIKAKYYARESVGAPRE